MYRNASFHLRLLHLLVRFQQLPMHLAALHIRPQRIQPKKPLVPIHQRMGLLQRRRPKQQKQILSRQQLGEYGLAEQ